jgi:hypothetical protein
MRRSQSQNSCETHHASKKRGKEVPDGAPASRELRELLSGIMDLVDPPALIKPFDGILAENMALLFFAEPRDAF